METVPNINVSKKQFDSEEHQVESPRLRDLLRKKEDNNGDRRTNHSDQTFNSGLNGERRGGSIDRVQSSRTLRDIFREDPNTTTTKEKKNITKNLSDKLFRRQGSGSGSSWTSSVPVPTSDVPIHPQNSFRNITRWDSTKKSGPPGRDGSDLPDSESGPPRSRSAMLQRNASRAMERPRVRFEGLSDDEAEEEEEMTDEGPGETTEAEENEGQDEDDGGSKGGCGGGEEEPVRMSLMSLLAETDKQMGLDGSAYAMEEDDDDDEEEEGGGYYNNCCVCMVRHKGAAFIPCGHTFCRLCSRELWVQRGNCPLCNNFILEILDIF